VGIKDELHDLRLVGWRDYWWLAYGQRAEQRRSERRQRRLMKTTTWDALVETLDWDEQDPMDWPQVEFEATMADTIAVEKRRWIERWAWITTAVGLAGLGYVVGVYVQPFENPDPQPWECVVAVVGEKYDDPDVFRCTGGYEQDPKDLTE
jgi:hypothetical protein